MAYSGYRLSLCTDPVATRFRTRSIAASTSALSWSSISRLPSETHGTLKHRLQLLLQPRHHFGSQNSLWSTVLEAKMNQHPGFVPHQCLKLLHLSLGASSCCLNWRPSWHEWHVLCSQPFVWSPFEWSIIEYTLVLCRFCCSKYWWTQVLCGC